MAAPASVNGANSSMSKTARALRAAFEHGDKEKRGVVSAEYMQVILKSLQMRPETLAPVIGGFTQVDESGAEVLKYGPLLDWLFGPSALPSASASDKVVRPPNGHVFAVLPGLGQDDYPGFPVEECPAQMPDLKGNCSMAARVLGEDASIYARLRECRTKLGVTFARCIKVGMDNPLAKIAGMVAGDADSYEVFKDLFDPVIQMFNGGKALSADHPHDLSLKVVHATPIDPSSSYTLAVRVEGSRNLEGFRFPSACSQDERQKVEGILTGAFECLGEDLQGKYFPLRHSSSCSSMPTGMSQEEEAQLHKDGFLFCEPDSKVQLSSGYGRHWPEARGVYVASSRRLVAWVNDEDHLHLCALQDSGDLWAAFARFADAISALEGDLKRKSHSFAQSRRLGYLTSSPTKVGAGLRAAVVLRLPQLSSRPGFSQQLANLGLRAPGGVIRRDGVVEVTHSDQMGISEANLVNTLAAGCAQLISMEKAFEVGDSQGAGENCGTVFSVLPGFGDSAAGDFPADSCPADLPSLAGNQTVMAQVLQKDPAIYELLRARRTSRGVTLATCIKPGMDASSVRAVGAVAGDEECYDVFKELFDPVVQQCHASYASTVSPHPAELSVENIRKVPIDPTGTHVLAAQVSGCRNIRGFRFGPSCDRAERCAVERFITGALLSLDAEDLRGEYYPLRCSTSYAPKPSGMTADEEAMLLRQGHLFDPPNSALLLAAGFGRHWPDARGVFVAASQGLVARCNEEEHLLLTSLQVDGDLGKAFARFAEATVAVEKHLQLSGKEFARHPRLGYLSPRPGNLGTGLRASVVLKLPLLSQTPEFQDTCEQMGLWVSKVRAVGSRAAGVYEATNGDQLGVSEVQLINMVLDGCKKLVELELQLESNLAAAPLLGEDVFAALHGLGEEDYPGFPADACPTEMPDLSKHQSVGANILQSSPSIYGALKDRKSKLGVSFARCIKPCVDNPSALNVCSVAGDAESYELFREFFDPLVKSCHGEDALADVHPHQRSSSAVSSVQIDHKYTVGVRVQGRRNLAAFRFPPACDQQEKKEVERVLAQALASLDDEELQGDYHPLSHFTAKTNGTAREDMMELERSGFLFRAPESPVELCSGVGRHWPKGRGVFIAKSRKFVAWCNEKDHLNLSSFQAGGDLWAAFNRWSKAINSLESSIGKDGHRFAHADRLGYLTVNPIHLGTTLDVSVTLKLPLLINTSRLQDVCKQLGVKAYAGRRGICEIVNCKRFGLAEADLVNVLINGCARLAEMESALEGGLAQLPRVPGAMPIEYTDISLLNPATLGTVVHFKGFSKGIDFCHNATVSLAEKAVELIASLKPNTLAWDGDSYQENSFTYLIPRIWDATKPRLIMFLNSAAEEQQRANESWPALGLPITCCLCQETVPWDELGAVGLKATQSKSVVSFGGGAVLKDEFLKASKDITFFVLPATRQIDGGARFEQCSLEGHVADNLKFIKSATRGSSKGSIRETLHSLLMRWDASKRRVVPVDKLKALLCHAAPGLNDREIQMVLKSLPYEVDGNVSFDAFLSWLYDSLPEP